jgi:hypothetical protein
MPLFWRPCLKDRLARARVGAQQLFAAGIAADQITLNDQHVDPLRQRRWGGDLHADRRFNRRGLDL